MQAKETCSMSRILIALCVLGVTSGSAHAQSSPFVREVRSTAGWVFTPGGSIGGVWDSGVQTGGDSGAEGVLQKFVMLANPRAELDFNGRRTHLNIGYSGSYEKYWAEGTNWEHRGRAGVRRTMSSRLDINGDFSYAAVPTTDRLLIVDGVVPYVPVNSSWVDGGGGFTLRSGPRTTINGGYRFERVAFDQTPGAAIFGELRNGFTHNPFLGFMREFSPRLSMGATAQYRRDNFGDELREFDVRSLTGEFSFRLNSSSSLTGGGGASKLTTIFTGDSTTSPTFHVGYDRAMRTFRLGTQYSRGFEALYGFGTLAGSDTFSASAYVPLADRLYYLDAVVAYSRTDSVRGLDFGIDYATTWSNVSVGRQLTPHLRGEGFISFAHQSNAGPDSTNRTRVGIQIVTSKPMRIQ
jgi:hypothetical protein